MNQKRIDMFHRFGPDQASSRYRMYLVKEQIEKLDNNYNVNIHDGEFKLGEKEFRGKNFIQSIVIGLKIGLISIKVWKKSDLFYIHKSLIPRDNKIIESFILKFDKTIFDLDDAEFLEMPEKVQMLFKKSSKVFAGSRFIKKEAEKYNSNSVLIPTAIDIERFRPMSVKEDEEFVVGWVGNAESHRENLRLILPPFEELSKKYEDLKLRLIGLKGEKDLKKEFFESNINVEIIDWVEPDDIPSEINKFDVGIMPLVDQKWERGKCALKALEYMSCEVPPVCSDVGENSYIIEHGNNGYLTDNEVSSWIEVIEKFKNLEEKEKMGKNARKTVVKNFNIEKISSDIVKEIESL